MQKVINDSKYKYIKSKIVDNLTKKYDLNQNIHDYLLYNYDLLYKKYGKLQATNDDSIRIYEDNMGIYFTETFDEEFIKVIKNLFYNNDVMYDKFSWPKLGDIIEQCKKYQNLSLSEIFNVLVYSQNSDYQEKLLEILNNSNLEHSKIIELIKPVSNYLINRSDWYYKDLIDYIKNSNQNDKTEEKLYMLNSIHHSISEKNIYFIKEFEYLFQKIFLENEKEITDELLNKLLTIKNFALNNFPKASGTIYYEPIYDYVDTSSFDKGTETYEESSSLEQIGEKEINTIEFYRKNILSQKKAILLLVAMLINNNINYEEFILLDEGKYIMNLIQELENPKAHKKTMKKSNEI